MNSLGQCCGSVYLIYKSGSGSGSSTFAMYGSDLGFLMEKILFQIFRKKYSCLLYISFEYEGIPLKEIKVLEKKFKQI